MSESAPWSRRAGADLASFILIAGLLAVLAMAAARPIELDSVNARYARVLPPIEMRIDINRADADELQNLPRIGPGLAGAIVTDRNERGDFSSFEELNRVHGIGDRTLLLIRPHVLPFGEPSARRPAVGEADDE